jgi:hypothetical protein
MDQLKSSVGWSTVRPLATTVTTEPATGVELVAFTIQIHHKFRLSAPLPTRPGESKAGGNTGQAGEAKFIKTKH